jgi:hypothetical protein
MKRTMVGLVVSVLATCSVFAQGPETQQAEPGPRWQRIDQLCGQLELAAPIQKQLLVGGEREARMYVSHVEHASMALFRAVADESRCCRSEPIDVAQSGQYGSFRFEGVRKGRYWLRVRKDAFEYFIPLEVTADFDARTCRDVSVGRSIVVDSKPPRVEVRIR